MKQFGWIRNPIDNFTLAKMEQRGLSPAPEADRRTLLRRVAFDLTGLPPSAGLITSFVADSSPDAYEKVVDRLLASPSYGERRARFWLDAVRYADTHGLHHDDYREIWPYRDWVIKAFNRDMTFDQFTREQLAGDLLPDATLSQLIATGYLRCNQTTSEAGTIEQENLALYTRDRTDNAARIWLGLTVGCAVCHDHKTDPITQKDFYSLSAFFNNGTMGGTDDNIKDPAPAISISPDLHRPGAAELAAQIAATNRQLEARQQAMEPNFNNWLALVSRHRVTEDAAIPADTDHRLPADGSAIMPADGPLSALSARPAQSWTDRERERVRDWWLDTHDAATRALRGKLDSMLREKNAFMTTTTLVMREKAATAEAFVLARGDYDKRLRRVQPDVPASLPEFPADAPRNRLGLADWLLSRDNPLTARVAVNRYWQEVFGTGLVKSADDFGKTGEPPSNAELLDWLAVEFRDSSWDIKRMFKLMVMSATYRQAAIATPEKAAIDSENRLLSRGGRYRLDAEEIRDQALFASGLLTRKMGGPSVRPYQPPNIWDVVGLPEGNTRLYVQDHGENLYRRSLYTFWKRQAPPPAMELFNAPSRENCTIRRDVTNTPMQAMVLLNDVTYVEAARNLAQHAMENGADFDSRLDYITRRLLTRDFEPAEAAVARSALADLSEFYHANPAEAVRLLNVGESARDPKLDCADHAAWTMLASQVMNLDESLTK